MAKQYRIKRRVQQVPVAFGQSVTVDLPRGYDIESVYLVLYGSIVLTTAGTAVRAESPSGLVQRAEIIADGKNTIASVRFDALQQFNGMRRGQGQRTPPGNTVATHPIRASMVIDQSIVDGVRPKDSALRTSGMSLLQLRLTFGALTDLYTGAPVGTLSNVFVDVVMSELVEIADESGEVTTPLYLLKRSYQDITIAGANSNLEIPLPVGNVFRGTLLRSSSSAEPSDSVINNVVLRSGVDVRINATYQNLKTLNTMDYGFAPPTGYVFADCMYAGAVAGVRASEGWDLTRASEAKLALDVSAPTAPAVSVMSIELLS